MAPSTPAPRRALAIESYLVIALVLVCLAGPIANRVARAPAVELRQSFDRFPMELGPWHGQMAYIDPEMVKATQSDAHLNAEFSHPGQPPVYLWIAYYETQKKHRACSLSQDLSHRMRLDPIRHRHRVEIGRGVCRLTT